MESPQIVADAVSLDGFSDVAIENARVSAESAPVARKTDCAQSLSFYSRPDALSLPRSVLLVKVDGPWLAYKPTLLPVDFNGVLEHRDRDGSIGRRIERE